jgi:hypothetical protein
MASPDSPACFGGHEGLVRRVAHIAGYNLFSLMRASTVVNCQRSGSVKLDVVRRSGAGAQAVVAKALAPPLSAIDLAE